MENAINNDCEMFQNLIGNDFTRMFYLGLVGDNKTPVYLLNQSMGMTSVFYFPDSLSGNDEITKQLEVYCSNRNENSPDAGYPNNGVTNMFWADGSPAGEVELANDNGEVEDLLLGEVEFVSYEGTQYFVNGIYIIYHGAILALSLDDVEALISYHDEIIDIASDEYPTKACDLQNVIPFSVADYNQ